MKDLTDVMREAILKTGSMQRRHLLKACGGVMRLLGLPAAVDVEVLCDPAVVDDRFASDVSWLRRLRRCFLTRTIVTRARLAARTASS